VYNERVTNEGSSHKVIKRVVPGAVVQTEHHTSDSLGPPGGVGCGSKTRISREKFLLFTQKRETQKCEASWAPSLSLALLFRPEGYLGGP
jgi:hypothetical protein